MRHFHQLLVLGQAQVELSLTWISFTIWNESSYSIYHPLMKHLPRDASFQSSHYQIQILLPEVLPFWTPNYRVTAIILGLWPVVAGSQFLVGYIFTFSSRFLMWIDRKSCSIVSNQLSYHVPGLFRTCHSLSTSWRRSQLSRTWTRFHRFTSLTQIYTGL